MIRKDRFTVEAGEFAAERRDILARTESRLEAAVRQSLTRLGLPGWEDSAVAMAVDIFDETASFESEAWTQVLDDLRADAQGCSSAALRAAQGAVEDTRRRLDVNVSEELALDQLAYRAAEALGH